MQCFVPNKYFPQELINKKAMTVQVYVTNMFNHLHGPLTLHPAY